jgi:hypothetical protein
LDPLAPTSRLSLSFVGGLTQPVGPRDYAAVGFGLMALKYAGEAAMVGAATGKLLPLWAFLSPALSLREPYYLATPWVAWVTAFWTLPFVWIGMSMTIRRVRDAGLPTWLGMLFFAPILNFLVMFGLCVVPRRRDPVPVRKLVGPDRVVWAAVLGVGGGAAIGLGMVGLSVFALGSYGTTLFVGTPFVMGTVAGFLLNLREPRSIVANLAVATLTVGALGGLMMMFALEGAICLAMAAPIGFAMTLMGVALGAGLARIEARAAVLASIVPLPLLNLAEPPPDHTTLHEVVSTVDIAAPPEVVWDKVIGFGGVELPPPPEWFFQLGIAYPQRAHIEGTGVGAVRYCEFSTGPFVEPITTWDAPTRLAFDVIESPPTMHEWSPYEKVHAPHLDGILKSRRGEFRLTPLPGGGTRLEGHTWYTFAMAPEAYWTLWSDAAIHRIHLRVLEHIKHVAESAN